MTKDKAETAPKPKGKLKKLLFIGVGALDLDRGYAERADQIAQAAAELDRDAVKRRVGIAALGLAQQQ